MCFTLGTCSKGFFFTIFSLFSTITLKDITAFLREKIPTVWEPWHRKTKQLTTRVDLIENWIDYRLDYWIEYTSSKSVLLHQSPLHKSTLHTSLLHLHCCLPLASSPWQQPTRLMGRVVLSVVISQTGENAQRFLTCFEVRQFLAAAQLVSWLAKCSFSR